MHTHQGWRGGVGCVSDVCLCERVWPCHRRLRAWPHKLHTPAGGLRRPRSGRVRQWEADGPGWRPYGAGGGGAFLPPTAARKPPACWPPIRAGAGADTVTNVPQPARSLGVGRTCRESSPRPTGERVYACVCVDVCARCVLGAGPGDASWARTLP